MTDFGDYRPCVWSQRMLSILRVWNATSHETAAAGVSMTVLSPGAWRCFRLFSRLELLPPGSLLEQFPTFIDQMR